MFTSVLIANRGEIALRIQRACRSSVSGRLPPIRRRTATRLMSVTRMSRSASGQLLPAAAISIHPRSCSRPRRRVGGDPSRLRFLSENADFAEAVAATGLTFIGPDASCIRAMGDKVAAKRAMREAGVCPAYPVPRGASGRRSTRAAGSRGHRLSRHPQGGGGGGGRGMRVVEREVDLLPALALTREEAGAASAIRRSMSRNSSATRAMSRSR